MRAVSDRSVKRRGGKIVKASPWIFRFLFLTGVRVSEAAGLLEENVAGGELRFRQKGNRLRSLPISKAAMREIQRSVSAKRRLGIGIPNVFFNCAGKPWNKDTIRRYWNRRIEAAGLPHRTPHEIRHTFCTLAGAEGFNVFQIQSASGHETASMLERYVHDSSEAALAVGEAVTERLGSVLYPNRTQKGGDSGDPASIFVNSKLPKGGVNRECPHCGKPLLIKKKGRNP
jgi:integrase